MYQEKFNRFLYSNVRIQRIFLRILWIQSAVSFNLYRHLHPPTTWDNNEIWNWTRLGTSGEKYLVTPRTKELPGGSQRLTTKPFRKSWCPPDESELSFNKVDHFYIWASLYFECFRFPSQRRCQIDWRLYLYTATTRSARAAQSNKCAMCMSRKKAMIFSDVSLFQS